MERDIEEQKRARLKGGFYWTLDKIVNTICQGMSCINCPLYGKLHGEKERWRDVLDENDCEKTRYYLETYRRLWNYYLLHKSYYCESLANFMINETKTRRTLKSLEKQLIDISTIQDMQKFICELYKVDLIDDIPECAKSW